MYSYYTPNCTLFDMWLPDIDSTRHSLSMSGMYELFRILIDLCVKYTSGGGPNCPTNKDVLCAHYTVLEYYIVRNRRLITAGYTALQRAFLVSVKVRRWVPSRAVSLKAIEGQREGWLRPLFVTYHAQNRVLPGHTESRRKVSVHSNLFAAYLEMWFSWGFQAWRTDQDASKPIDIVEMASLRKPRLAWMCCG